MAIDEKKVHLKNTKVNLNLTSPSFQGARETLYPVDSAIKLSNYLPLWISMIIFTLVHVYYGFYYMGYFDISRSVVRK